MTLLVDLGHAPLTAALDKPDLGFLAAHERADDTVDDSEVEDLLQTLGDSHALNVSGA